MKLTEVSTGASTMKFADYLQHMKQIGVSPKTIGELHSIGINCLKGGAIFDDSDDDDIRMVFKHGYVQLLHKVESKAFLGSKVELFLEQGDDPARFSAAKALNLGYRAFGVAEAAKFNFGQLFKNLEQAADLVAQSRSMLGDD